jgi:hypothetical protein
VLALVAVVLGFVLRNGKAVGAGSELVENG